MSHQKLGVPRILRVENAGDSGAIVGVVGCPHIIFALNLCTLVALIPSLAHYY